MKTPESRSFSVISTSVSDYCLTCCVGKHHSADFLLIVCLWCSDPIFPTWLTWSSITQRELRSPLLQLPCQQKHEQKQSICPPLTLMPSPFVLLRCAETKKMSGSWFVLCLLVLGFLHSHRPLGENHPGGARHRDQRYTLLLPDALCGAASHL